MGAQKRQAGGHITARAAATEAPTPDSGRLRALIDRHRGEILRLAREYGARDVRVFGSVARGDAGPHSDVDLLVTFAEVGERPRDGFSAGIEEALGVPVEIVANRSDPGPRLLRIMAESVPLDDGGGWPMTRQPGGRTERDLYEDMRDAVDDAIVIIGRGRDAFLADRLLQRAAAAVFVQLDEVSTRLGGDAERTFPEIDWKQLRDLRNRLVHRYEGVDYEQVWDAVAHDIAGVLSPLLSERKGVPPAPALESRPPSDPPGLGR